MATNDYFLLQGWRFHDELWRAYLNPDDDHSELIESMRLHLEQRAGGYTEDFQYVAHPIGMGWRVPDSLIMWDPMMSRYRQSEPFIRYIRESGAYDFWLEHGFPPQCRPLGDRDFECN